MIREVQTTQKFHHIGDGKHVQKCLPNTCRECSTQVQHYTVHSVEQENWWTSVFTPHSFEAFICYLELWRQEKRQLYTPDYLMHKSLYMLGLNRNKI